MFDGVHCGHRHLLSQLKERCDEALAVTFANHPLDVIDSARKPLLISTPDEKDKLLRSEGVTPVMLRFDEELRRLTAEQFVSILAREHGIERSCSVSTTASGATVAPRRRNCNVYQKPPEWRLHGQRSYPAI